MIAGVGFGFAASAADWTVQPVIDVGAIRDDNIRLTPGPHESTSGYVAAADLEVRRETERSKADFAATAVYSRYTSGDVDDTTEQRAALDVENRTSERGTLGLNARYRRDTVYKTTVVEEGTGDIRDVDIGLTTAAEVRRHRRVVEPAWDWLLTERSAVRFSYRRTDVSFTDAAGSGLVDYQEDLLSGTYTRQLTPRDEFHLTANAAEYSPEGDDNKSETVQLRAGLARAFSETLRGSFSVGARRTTEQRAVQEDRSTGLAASATLRQRSELSTLEGVISRDVAPSGIGRAVRTDQVRVYWKRRTAPRTEFVFDARWLRAHVVEGSDAAVERRYYELSPKLRWLWLENTSVVASYRYRFQKFAAAADSADSSTVFLGVSYRL